MPNGKDKQLNFTLKVWDAAAGFIISCPDFYHGKIFTNENLTDKVAHEYLTKYPHMEKYFQKIPSEEHKPHTPSSIIKLAENGEVTIIRK